MFLLSFESLQAHRGSRGPYVFFGGPHRLPHVLVTKFPDVSALLRHENTLIRRSNTSMGFRTRNERVVTMNSATWGKYKYRNIGSRVKLNSILSVKFRLRRPPSDKRQKTNAPTSGSDILAPATRVRTLFWYVGLKSVSQFLSSRPCAPTPTQVILIFRFECLCPILRRVWFLSQSLLHTLRIIRLSWCDEINLAITMMQGRANSARHLPSMLSQFDIFCFHIYLRHHIPYFPTIFQEIYSHWMCLSRNFTPFDSVCFIFS